MSFKDETYCKIPLLVNHSLFANTIAVCLRIFKIDVCSVLATCGKGDNLTGNHSIEVGLHLRMI